MDFEGARGNHRGRYEAMENVRRNDARARRERIDAEATRNRLEKCASVGQRAGLGRVVGMAAVDALASRSLEGTLDALRRAAQVSPIRKAAAERPSFEDQDDARDERYTPKLEAGRVRDSAGSMDADARTRADLFGGQGVSDAMNSLSVEDMRHIMSMRIRERFF